jgi:ammonia channel protein AmtB
MCEPWEAFFVGLIGALLTVPTDALLTKLKIDDPVGVIPVHFVCAVWGLLSVGKIPGFDIARLSNGSFVHSRFVHH